MSDSIGDRPFPPPLLLGAGALIALALIGVAVVRVTGPGTHEPPPAAAVASRDLRFVDRDDGGVDVYDASAVRPLAGLAPGTNGFLRATLRGLARERRRQGLGPEVPFHLAARADGRLTLSDPATGRQIDLEAFGSTNAQAFARLLAGAPAAGAAVATRTQ